jgi:hypothetical protein
MSGSNWFWVRFKSPADDYRPIDWKPPGPFWCTGYDSSDNPIIVAYIREKDQLYDYWPDANDIDFEPKDEIEFSSRFPKPDWFGDG